MWHLDPKTRLAYIGYTRVYNTAFLKVTCSCVRASFEYRNISGRDGQYIHNSKLSHTHRKVSIFKVY